MRVLSPTALIQQAFSLPLPTATVAGAFSQKGHFLSGKPDHFQRFTFQAGWAAWAAEAWFGQLWILV